jgi:hypothetical protein
MLTDEVITHPFASATLTVYTFAGRLVKIPVVLVIPKGLMLKLMGGVPPEITAVMLPVFVPEQAT